MREDLQEIMRRGVKAAEGKIYSGKHTLGGDRYRAKNEAQWITNYQTFERWASQHLEIPRNNEGRVVESVLNSFQQYMDWTDPLQVDDFEFAFGNLSSQMQLQAVPTPEEAKAALIEEILSLLRNPKGGDSGGKHSDFQLKTERTKMTFWTLAQLQVRLDEVRMKQSHAAKPLGQLKAEVAQARESKRGRYFPYLELPKEIVPAGKVRAVTVNAAYIKSLPAPVLRQWAAKYGYEQLNDAIASRR